MESWILILIIIIPIIIIIGICYKTKCFHLTASWYEREDEEVFREIQNISVKIHPDPDLEDQEDIDPWSQLLEIWTRTCTRERLIFSDEAFEDFLPQIITLMLLYREINVAKHKSKKRSMYKLLKELFYRKLEKSVHFAFRAYCYLGACSKCGTFVMKNNCNAIRAEIKGMLKKDSARYKWFRGELELCTYLENLSQELSAYSSKKHRNEVLRLNLKENGKRLYKGLSLPLQLATQPYIEILRPVHHEAQVLNSAKKVPFAMTWEVLVHTETPTCGDVHLKVQDENDIPNIFHLDSPELADVSSILQHADAYSSKRTSMSKDQLRIHLEQGLDQFASDRSRRESLSRDYASDTEGMAIMPSIVRNISDEEFESISYDSPQIQSKKLSHKRESISGKMSYLELDLRASNTAPINAPQDGGLELPPSPSRSQSAFKLYDSYVDAIADKSALSKEHEDSWTLQTVIFKSGEDLRQEALAYQFTRLFNQIFEMEKVPIELISWPIVPTSSMSGFVDFIRDSQTISNIRKDYGNLHTFWLQQFGPTGSATNELATTKFTHTLAGWSLVTHILNIKDRHNGNIMIVSDGSLTHIDFGFLFTTSPAGNMNFESSPFKLSTDYIQVMGEMKERSKFYILFNDLFRQSFLAIRKHFAKVLLIVDIMIQCPGLDCFQGGRKATINGLKQRMFYGMEDEEQLNRSIDELIQTSLFNPRSYLYDEIQKAQNGVY